MMGWIALAGIGIAAFLALAVLGVSRNLWSFAGAALMLGAAGFALQANPAMPGAPANPASKAQPDEPALRELRGAMFGRFGVADSYFFAADALVRSGDGERAAKFMLGGVRASPRDVALWTWLGMTLVEADERTMSPAAGVAFRRAVALAPKHPGPPFFYGLAYVRTGKFAEALPWWRRALALTPRDTSYREAIASRVSTLEQFLALQARDAAAPVPAQ